MSQRPYKAREPLWYTIAEVRGWAERAGFTFAYHEPEGWPASAGET